MNTDINAQSPLHQGVQLKLMNNTSLVVTNITKHLFHID